MRFKQFYFFVLGLLLILSTTESFATHMRGGEISVKRISSTSFTYEFTLTIYCDLNTGLRAWQDQQNVSFCFGDGIGNINAPRINGGGSGENIGNGIGKGIYKAIYTYAGAADYKVTVAISNRNQGVRNIGGASDAVAFYVETIFKVNPGLGLNSTPVLLNPAVDLTAVVGQKFIHNPNAIDVDGDSLAYKLTFCRRGDQDNCTDRKGDSVPGFRQPNEVATTPSSFTINAKTGDLIWDVPQEIGLYNCAFYVEEWRNGVLISITERDMQIEVKDADNKPPVIKVPDDICVEAGTLISQTITATDTPSNSGRVDNMTIISTGAVYRLPDGTTFIGPQYATFTSTANQASPASGRFVWQTGCNHIRQEPYDILFKAQDLPRSGLIPSLVDSKIWKIRIVAPRIKNLKATGDAANKTITLTWDSYTCQNVGSEIVIYRKEGCTNYTPNSCDTGLPASLGYVEVARVPVSSTSYVDKNLKRNTDYSYRTVVVFTNGINKAESIVSDQTCTNLPIQMSVMTNVTVDKTDATTGEMTIKWTRPLGLDKNVFKGPYQYRLSRATGLNGTNFVQVSPNIDTDLSGKADTIFVDKNLNTTANAYTYRIAFYYTSNTGLTLLDSTDKASSVRLAATPDKKSVRLTWQAIVPWKNENQIHRVYRETRSGSGVFNRIADVPVTTAGTFAFTDTGADTYAADGIALAKMSQDSSYCYKVETVGTYGDARIKPDIYYNFSQIICATPLSDIVPCAPQLTIDLLDCDKYKKDNTNCDLTSFENKLTWTNPDKSASGSDCTKDIVKYTIYYAESSDGTYTKVGEVTSPTPPAQTFTHIKNDSYLGCYYVTATDKYGTESAPSNKVCKDNCPSFELPNVFTPNGDGKNDIFQAMRCPRFVQSVIFSVYNRAGQKVYDYTGPKLAWNGTDTNGKELPVGTYFYNAEVKFLMLDPSYPTVKLKGWIELLR